MISTIAVIVILALLLGACATAMYWGDSNRWFAGGFAFVVVIVAAVALAA